MKAHRRRRTDYKPTECRSESSVPTANPSPSFISSTTLFSCNPIQYSPHGLDGIHTISHQSLHYAACSHYPWLAILLLKSPHHIFCCAYFYSASFHLFIAYHRCSWLLNQDESYPSFPARQVRVWASVFDVIPSLPQLAGLSTVRHAACSFRPTYGPAPSPSTSPTLQC